MSKIDTKQFLKALATIQEDMLDKEFGKGRPGQSSIACPVCSGTISYSVANNGHIAARCDSKECIGFIQ